MRIGLTYTGNPEKDQNYVRWIRGGDWNGGDPEGGDSEGGDVEARDSEGGDAEAGDLERGDVDIEVIRLAAEDSNLSAVDSCDGLVLSGGIDIDPELYGSQAGYAKAPSAFRRDRDEFEKAALLRAWELGLPVFGVCRGLQLINVVRGGTLVQDLGVDDEMHQNVGLVDKVHQVAVFDDTLLRAITGEAGEVNSAHHQGIDQLGEGLRVNCQAADGTIEGIEWAEAAGKPFMLAVQWHPERMFINDFKDKAFYSALRDRFIQAIKKGN